MVTKTIDSEIDHVLLKMSTLEVSSDEYNSAAEAIRILCEARSKRPAKTVESEVLVMAGVNILGILLILYFERFNVVTSRALGFIIKR